MTQGRGRKPARRDNSTTSFISGVLDVSRGYWGFFHLVSVYFPSVRAVSTLLTFRTEGRQSTTRSHALFLSKAVHGVTAAAKVLFSRAGANLLPPSSVMTIGVVTCRAKVTKVRHQRQQEEEQEER